MQFMEASKKAGLFRTDYAAMVVVVATSREGFLAELTEAIRSIEEWKSYRKKAAKTVLITVSGKSEFNEFIQHVLTDSFQTEPDFVALKQGTDFDVSILNRGTTPSVQFRL
jgi:hypothetical protein